MTVIVVRNLYWLTKQQTRNTRFSQFTTLTKNNNVKTLYAYLPILFNKSFNWEPDYGRVGGPKHVAINKQLCLRTGKVCTFIYITIKICYLYPTGG